MSHLEGVPLSQWLARKPSAALRNVLGRRLWELFFFQVFRARVLHADPHPGNYLFSPNGGIGLVDFGCIKEITPDLVKILRCFFEPLRPLDEEGMGRLVELIWGDRVSCDSPRGRQLLEAGIGFSKELFPPPGGRRGLVDFGSGRVLTCMAPMAKEIFRDKLIRPDLVFFKRSEMGLYNYLHQLGAQLDVRGILEPLLGPR